MPSTPVLSIFKLADSYLFQFQPGDTPVAILATSAQLPAQEQNLRHQFAQIAHQLNQFVTQQPSTPPNEQPNDPLLGLGRILYNQLLPPPIQQALQTLPSGSPLLLASNESEIPWELAHDSQTCLSLKFNLARQLLSPHPFRQSPPTARHNWSSLLIGNPTGDLPATSQEIRQLDNLLRTLPSVTQPRIFMRLRATKAAILQELTTGNYDLIHFSGHALFSPQEPHTSGLLLAGGEILTITEIERNLAGHPFVFLNACNSGRSDVKIRPDITASSSAAQGVAAAFLQGGARGICGALWPILDSSSQQFALSFYRAALQGETVGAALRSARTGIRQHASTDPAWASYVLYGQPTEVLIPITHQEPRQVTVLQANLAGLGELYQSLALATAAGLERQLMDTFSVAIHPYGGNLASEQSGKLLICFGIATTYEDDALRALHTALALRSALQSFQQQADTPLPQALHLHIGISTGQVLRQHNSTAQDKSYWITSNIAVNADKLAERAGADEIWVDEATQRQTQPLVLFATRQEDNGQTSLVTPTAFQALALRPPSATGSASPTNLFIGRETELASLQSWWREASRGQGRLVSLTGAPGVGKSRLVQTFRTTLTEQSQRWLSTTCHSYEQQRPYALLSQLLFEMAGITTEDTVAIRMDKLETLVRTTIVGLGQPLEPWQTDFLALLAHALGLPFPTESINSLEPKLRQQRLTGCIQVLCTWQSRQQPLLICLEDVQLADEATLAVLRPLIHNISQLHILVLLVHRSEWQSDWTTAASYRSLPLDILPETAQQTLFADLLEGLESPAGLAQAILSRTGGNPFFITEVVRSLQENNLLVRIDKRWMLTTPLDQSPIPTTVDNAIQARIDRLMESSRQVLMRAAVIGAEFDHALLEQVQEEPVRQQLEPSLEELTRRDFLRSSMLFTFTYAFRHALIQESVYNKLLVPYRRVLHRLVAHALEGLAIDPKASRLAHHYYHSDDRLNAIRYTLQAAQQAFAAWSNHTAITEYDRALETLQSFVTEPASQLEQEQGATPTQLIQWQVAALNGKAEAQTASGANSDAIENFIAALSLTTNPQLFPAEQHAELYRKLAIAYHDRGELDASWNALEQGLALLPNQPSTEAGRIHIWRGMIQVRRGHFTEGLVAYQQAISMVGQNALIQDLSKAYNLLGVIYRRLGRTEEALDVLEKNIHHCQAANYLPGLARAYSNLGCVYQDLGHWDEVLTYGQKSAALCERTGDVRQQASVAIDMGEIYRRRGQLKEAIAAYTQAQQIGEQFDFPEITGMALLNQAATYLRQADLHATERCLTSGAAILQQNAIDQYTPELLRLQSELHLQQGEFTQALTIAQDALNRATQQGEELEVGIIHRVIGQIYTRLGGMSIAASHFEQSLLLLRHQHSQHEIGLVLLAVAKLYDMQVINQSPSTAPHEQPNVVCKEAITLFRQLGADIDLAEANELYSRLNGK